MATTTIATDTDLRAKVQYTVATDRRAIGPVQLTIIVKTPNTVRIPQKRKRELDWPLLIIEEKVRLDGLMMQVFQLKTQHRCKTADSISQETQYCMQKQMNDDLEAALQLLKTQTSE